MCDQIKNISAAQLASIIQMSGQVSRGSAGEYQADEQAEVLGCIFKSSFL